jgi:hypothetical protein
MKNSDVRILPQAKKNILGESPRKLFKLDYFATEEKRARLDTARLGA